MKISFNKNKLNINNKNPRRYPLGPANNKDEPPLAVVALLNTVVVSLEVWAGEVTAAEVAVSVLLTSVVVEA